MTDANTLHDLNRRFAIPGAVSVEPGQGGLPYFAITAPMATAHLYLHGAHVTHFQPRGVAPILFMSAIGQFVQGKPIRGGVPIIFPWFGPHASRPDLPAHGFARTREWTPRETKRLDNDRISVSLALSTNEETRKLWPHDCELTFSVVVGATLEMSLAVRNTSATEIVFEEALHTYLSVGDVRQVEVEGLNGREFIDKMDDGQRKRQSGSIRLDRETDRVYVGAPDTVTAQDPAIGRKLVIAKEGSLATVVWNPWIDKARRMPDFGDDEWPRMLCIETANAADHAIRLEPGREHVMRASVAVAESLLMVDA